MSKIKRLKNRTESLFLLLDFKHNRKKQNTVIHKKLFAARSSFEWIKSLRVKQQPDKQQQQMS